MEKIVNTIAGLIWSDALVYLSLGVGLYFTVITRGVQFRYLGEMIKLLSERKASEAGVSSFQAFCMSLSSRVGVGNIAGVATAISAGGPGAILWMNVMALLGGASAFVESTLAQAYKENVNNQYRGGGPWYIEKGLNLKWFAIIVAAVVCLSYGILVPGIQANTIAESFNNAFHISSIYSAVIIMLPLALIIFGGVKRIARVADLIVPFMAGAYIIMMIIILCANIHHLYDMVALIIKSAFGTDAVFGGIVGYAVSWGVRRAVFSNVAGAGEATYSSAAAEVSHPVKQGLVQAFSVYIDTVLVCTATGVMILATGMYNVIPPNMEGPLVEHISGIAAGPAWTQAAISTVFPSIGSSFVAIAIFFFAFTCLLAYYYIAETALVYLLEKFNLSKNFLLLKIIFLLVTVWGCLQKASVMWGLGDIGFGSMCYLNFIMILLLTKPAVKLLKDYERQKKLGKNPIFNSTECHIPNTDFWKDKLS